MEGKGTLQILPEKLTVTAHCVNRKLLLFVSCAACALTVAGLLPWGWRVAGWGFPSVVLWIVLLYSPLSKNRIFVIDPKQGRAYRMRYPQITYQPQYEVVSIELSSGKWLAISALDGQEQDALTHDLQVLYGDRMAYAKGMKERVGA